MKILSISRYSPKPTPPKSHAKDRILLIDSDPLHRACLKEFLERRGYVCSEASNSVEGLAVLHEQAVALLIIDNHVPQIDGLAFVERVNHDYSREVLPMFLIADELSDAIRLRAFKNGVQRVFVKPFDFQELCHAVDWVTKFDLHAPTSSKTASNSLP